MHPTPHGHLLPQDAEGFLINECEHDKVSARWWPAVDAVIATYQAHLGAGLRSVWLRGSIPRGLGVDGVSDLDTLALVEPNVALEPGWTSVEAERLSREHSRLRGIELWLLSERALLDDPAQRHRLSMLATQALCVHGDALTGRLPQVRPGLQTVYACRSLRPYLSEAFTDLQAAGSAEGKQSCLTWIAKCLVRAGLEICIPLEPVFTRDLWPCWEVFSRHHPERREAMFEAMTWAIAPAEAPEEAPARLRRLADWMLEQAAAVWGHKLVG